MVYLSAIHNWVTYYPTHNNEGKSYREFIREITDKLFMPVSFDIRMIELIKEYERQLTDQTKLRFLELLVKQLITSKFIPKLRGQGLLLSLSELSQRLNNFLVNYNQE